MGLNFKIAITAVDKATSVVRHVNEAFSKAGRPIAEFQKALGTFSKESGLGKFGAAVGETLSTVGSSIAGVAEKMSGAIPMVGGALGVAGIINYAAKWGELGSSIKKTSAIIGVSKADLQELRGAARLADVDTGSLDGGIRSLGTTMENILYHKPGSENALSAMSAMGLKFYKGAGGSPDIVRGFNDIADAVQRLNGNPYAQQTLLNSLGLGDDLLPLLQQGSEGLKRFRDEYAKTKAVISDQDIEKASGFRDSFVLLGDAVEGWAMRHISAVGDVSEFNNANAMWLGDSGPNPWKPVAKGLWDGARTFSVNDDKRSLGDDVSSIKSWFGGKDIAPVLARGVPSAAVSSNGIEIDGNAPIERQAEGLAAAQAPKVSIEILMKNAPAGSQVRAHTADGIDVPARVEYGMSTTSMP